MSQHEQICTSCEINKMYFYITLFICFYILYVIMPCPAVVKRVDNYEQQCCINGSENVSEERK